MAIAEHLVILSQMASALASITVDEPQSNIWSVNATYKPRVEDFGRPFYIEPKSLRYWVFPPGALYTVTLDTVPDFFVAGLPVGTTTGVLRQHLMRLNSSLSCEEIDPSDFPSPCPGDRPFTVSWKRVVDTDVRVCVPGNYTASPWTLSRNRQEHTEEMYIDVNNTSIGELSSSENPRLNTSYTIRCIARTTRGYFELGNDWNNYIYGPLLEQWPNPEQMADKFNDWTDTSGHGSSQEKVKSYVPSDVDTFEGLNPPPQYVEPFESRTWKVPGPLMTSALALFGNGSWLSTAANSMSNRTYHSDDPNNKQKLLWQLICRGMPFSKLFLPSDFGAALKESEAFVSLCGSLERKMFDGYGPVRTDPLRATQHLIAAFAPVVDLSSDSKEKILYSSESLLRCAMFVANRAFLTLLSPDGVRDKERDLTGRKIYTSPGISVQKPTLSKATLIVLSVLIGIQLLGLGYLTYYLYRVPSWSDQLDAMAMARMGASLGNRGVLPAIGPVTKRDFDFLQTMGGLIGIVEKSSRCESSMTRSVSPDLVTTRGSEVELQRLIWTKKGPKSDKDGSTSVELGLDGSGPILITHLPQRSPYVLGLKKAWRATFISRERSSVSDA